MKLKALLSGIEYVVLQNSEQVEQADVLRIVQDSRCVMEGDRFVGIRGPRTDGHDFIWNVYEKKGNIFLVE